ncbi:MAG: hypothetical protein K1X74_04840 [Pirellulales bacterium]|nr:hypothetical protein [Pirellulales bacterium]
MPSGLSVEIQLYLAGLAIAFAAPLFVFWLLAPSLAHFLRAIFAQPEVERFWKRLTIIVFVAASVSSGIAYHPDASANSDLAVLTWSFADQVKQTLDNLLWAMLAIFLPLLLAYMVLYAGRRAVAPTQGTLEGER